MPGGLFQGQVGQPVFFKVCVRFGDGLRNGQAQLWQKLIGIHAIGCVRRSAMEKRADAVGGQ